MPTPALSGNQVLVEKDTFSIQEAGSSRINYFLKGLAYKFTVKARGFVREVVFYSSDVPGSETNEFTLTNEGSGTYSYTEVAGTGATALSIATDPNADFTYGIKFYFRIKIVGENLDRIIERHFWVRDPETIFQFGDDKINYVSPYPVLVGSRVVPLHIAEDAKNQAGVVIRGGIKSLQIFTTTTAPSTGQHVAVLGETAITTANLADTNKLGAITLTDRSSGTSIPGFIPPPGAPDFSRYYHYVTFRARAKLSSATYRDFNVILFAARRCKGDDGDYGYDSTGTGLPAPIPQLLTLDVPAQVTQDPPPPTCSSKTTLKTTTSLSRYANRVQIVVYSASTGGTVLAQGNGTVINNTQVEITRTALGGTTNDPINGHYEIKEYGPDRTSTNRVKTFTHGCAVEPIGVQSITTSGSKVQITKTVGSRVFDGSKTYKIKVYDQEIAGSLTQDISATVVDTSTLQSTAAVTAFSGWIVIEESGILCSAPPESFTHTPITNITWGGSAYIDTYNRSKSNQVLPWVVAIGSSKAICVFQQNDASGYVRGYAAVYSGGSWGTEAVVSVNNAYDTSKFIRIAKDSTNGKAMVCFDQETATTSIRFYANIYTGSAWTGPAYVDNSIFHPVGTPGNMADCTMNSSSHAFVMFSGQDDDVGDTAERFYVTYYNGSSWGTPTGISTNDGNAVISSVDSWNSGRIVMNDSNKAVAVFVKRDAGWNERLYANTYNGSAWGGMTQVDVAAGADPDGYQFDIAINASGNAILVWKQTDGSYSRIYSRKWNGSSWDAATIIDGAPGHEARVCRVAINDSNIAYCAFVNDNAVFTEDIRVVRYNGTSWGTPTLMTTGPYQERSEAEIIMDNDEKVILNIYGNTPSADSYVRFYNGSSWQSIQTIGTGVNSIPFTVDMNGSFAVAAGVEYTGNRRIFANIGSF